MSCAIYPTRDDISHSTAKWRSAQQSRITISPQSWLLKSQMRLICLLSGATVSTANVTSVVYNKPHFPQPLAAEEDKLVRNDLSLNVSLILPLSDLPESFLLILLWNQSLSRNVLQVTRSRQQKRKMFSCPFFPPLALHCNTALQRGTTGKRGGISSTSCLNKCLQAFQPIEALARRQQCSIFMQV